MRYLFLVFMTLWAVPAWAVSVEQVPNPRARMAWISDSANIIDATAEAEMETIAQSIRTDFDCEVTVVTVKAVDTATPKDFATKLYNHWGVGLARNNAGLLILMVTSERRIEMETGYGLEAALPDSYLKQLQTRFMVPEFKKGDYSRGLLKGMREIKVKLSNDKSLIGASAPSPQKGHSGDGNLWLLLLAPLGVGGAAGGRYLVKKKNRTCIDCGEHMAMIPDDEDDEHLEEGEQMEEALGSVDYEIYFCPRCSYTKTIRQNKWFSGRSNCPSCSYKTATTHSSTIEAATTYSTGLTLVESSCANCNYQDSYTKTIPRIATSSSSSSGGFGGGSSGGFGGSSGGSFGGGSSGGGGAGSSW